MTNSNARLHIAFDFELVLPAALEQGDEDALLEALRTMLGSTVFNGMPTVTGKQLNKSGVSVVKHHCQCEVKRVGLPSVPRDAVIAAAPHLNDEEVEKAMVLAAQKIPNGAAQQRAHIRRVALKLANHYRLVACTVAAEQSAGGPIEMTAHLNLTNGGVLVDDDYKKLRLKTDQAPIAVRINNTDIVLTATLGGHTLGGPLLEVSIDALAPHRDTLIACWQAEHTESA